MHANFFSPFVGDLGTIDERCVYISQVVQLKTDLFLLHRYFVLWVRLSIYGLQNCFLNWFCATVSDTPSPTLFADAAATEPSIASTKVRASFLCSAFPFS